MNALRGMAAPVATGSSTCLQSSSCGGGSVSSRGSRQSLQALHLLWRAVPAPVPRERLHGGQELSRQVLVDEAVGLQRHQTARRHPPQRAADPRHRHALAAHHEVVRRAHGPVREKLSPMTFTLSFAKCSSPSGQALHDLQRLRQAVGRHVTLAVVCSDHLQSAQIPARADVAAARRSGAPAPRAPPERGFSFSWPRNVFFPTPRPFSTPESLFLASVFFQASLRGPKKTNVFLTTLFAAVKEGTTVFFSTPQRLATDPASFSGPRNVFFSAFAEHTELQKGGVKCCCSIASEQVQFTTLNFKP